MVKDLLGRRKFLAASAGAVAAMTTSSASSRAHAKSAKTGKLAILGGDPIRTKKGWPRWPHIDDAVVDSVVKTTKSGIWCRIQSSHGTVPTFEKKFAKMEGAKLCVCTGSGTQSLHTSVEALGIGPGDEVITSPYTDPGTVASILAARALPVLADLDVESYQIDPDDVERRVTKYT
ncbi:MAG: DegT/DnrJ/EryC1/StrS aminotransferase family protein, partial [Pirellulales bacterium]|nr:DegT/DnrJ/EryC1/StrS aminotransferase family protein [Pirellulales bacterium]